MRVHVRPVRKEDIEDLIPILNRGFNCPWPPEEWRRLFEGPGTANQPNLGFVLESNLGFVGFLGTVYSERFVGERIERFCNISSWYTHPEFRYYSTRLLMAVLNQSNYTFTALTPSQISIRVAKKLGFLPLESEKVMSSPWLYRVLVEKKKALKPGGRFYKAQRLLEALIEAPLVKGMEQLYWDVSPEVDGRQIELLTEPGSIRPLLSTTDRQLLDDHPQCGHFLVLDGHSYSYVITKKRKVSFMRRSLVEFVISDVLYLSRTEPALENWNSLCRVIANRECSHAVLADKRFFGEKPPNGLRLPYLSYFMGKGEIRANQIDSLYTEIALLDLLFYV